MPYIGRELDRGNYLKLDDISSSFNGSTTTFNLTNGGKSFYPGSAFSILVVLAGVVQEPEAAYQINQAQITFASAPLAGDQFFCIVLGQALGVNTPANGSVNGAQLAKPFNYDNYFYLDDANNRVGVGTATPMTPLHVEGTGRFTDLTVTGDLTVEGTTSTLDTVVTEVDKLEVGANNTTVGVAITQSGTGDILRLYDSSTQVVTVKDGGFVAIGTQIEGESGADDLTIATSSTTGITIRSGTSNAGNIYFSDGTSGFDEYRGIVQYVHNEDSLILGTNGSEKLRIHSTGWQDSNASYAAVGINTFASWARTGGAIRAEVGYNAETTDYMYFGTGTNHPVALRVNNDTALYIKNDTGRSVGIGTDDPQSQFEVYGTSPIIRSKHSTSQKYTQINHNGTDGYLDWSSGGLIFRGASNTERLRITSAGRILKGITTARGNFANNVSGAEIDHQIEGTSYSSSSLSLVRNSNDANDGAIVLGKTRSTSTGGITVVQAGDDLGDITFAGADGTSLQHGANIIAEVQSGVGNDDMPTDLIFKTNGGTTYTTERLRILSSGQVAIGESTNYANANADDLIVGNRSNNESGITIGSSNQGQIAFADSSADRAGLIHYQHTDNSMRFYTNGPTNERLRITSGGVVGINKTSPSSHAQLDVVGSSY